MDQPIDTVLRGGRVIDPASGLDGIADVALSGAAIAAVGPNLPAEPAHEVIDVTGKLVIPGMIDTHGHVYQHVTGQVRPVGRHGRRPVGRHHRARPGRPELHDPARASASSSSSRRETRVLCFISAYLVGGLEGHLYPELYGPEQVNVAATVKAARENRDLVRGIKAHAEIGGASRWGLEVIKLGKRIAAEAGLPLYIHLGQLWPTKDVGDRRSGRGRARAGADHGAGRRSRPPVHPPPRRVHLGRDRRGASGGLGGAGAGASRSMSAMAAISASTWPAAPSPPGIRPTTLGADMHGYNVRVPDAAAEVSANPFFGVAPFNLTNAMTKLLALGLACRRSWRP